MATTAPSPSTTPEWYCPFSGHPINRSTPQERATKQAAERALGQAVTSNNWSWKKVGCAIGSILALGLFIVILIVAIAGTVIFI